MSFLDAAWSALGNDPAALADAVPPTIPLSAALPVGDLVGGAVSAAALAHAPGALLRLDPARVATAVTSERYLRVNGEPWQAWAEFSGFWQTADGWVRTHANYPHHREALLDVVGGADGFRRLTSLEIEEQVTARGGVAVAVRSEEEWRAHPQAAAVARSPFVRLDRVGDAPRRSGVPRVLDLTRVIAGPVATRTLAFWGADVLRIDGPRLPEIEAQHLDTGAGKRSAILDAGSARFDELLAEADVVVTGYRPVALERLGLSPEALVERRPGLVVARLSAWGATGPFAARRGFDSIVQAASGISWLESADGATPGALPAQALDHSAGHLLAAGVATALRRRAEEGGSYLVETSLARVAQELLAAARGPRPAHPAWEPTTVTYGDLTVARPAFPGEWPAPPVPWGSSEPRWK